MSKYQVFARKYRPQTFLEVLGQSPIVTTLKNAIKNNRLAHAYLFCGPRGTGKTTLARVFAKALNCLQPGPDLEPCNSCSSCKEITSGNALNVLEIDGASNRGIDDIRQINETVGFSSSSNYKIYIIDEVHMLTKEAFNALLKTLEEPPPQVKFFFATTEPHKVLPTILSRCQRFNLSRIPSSVIIEKLRRIANETGSEVEEEALRMVAERAEGGLRDAESIFDQILAFHENEAVTVDSVASILGVMPREVFFELDRSGKEGNLAMAFEIAHKVFAEGKDLLHFVDTLTDHFRTILVVKLSGADSPTLTLSESDRAKYAETAKLYRQDQCLMLLDYLSEMQNKIRFSPSNRITLETILLYVMRSHFRVPVDILIHRLNDLEKKLSEGVTELKFQPAPPPPAPPKKATPPSVKPSITEDPTPSLQDLGIKEKPKKAAPPQLIPQTPVQQSRTDTLLQFAAVELEGTIQKHPQPLRK